MNAKTIPSRLIEIHPGTGIIIEFSNPLLPIYCNGTAKQE